MPVNATLVFFCGKMGSGKSTTSKQIATDTGAILISEDEWLARLYPDEIGTFDDYLRYSSRLKPIIKILTRDLLASGVSVVLDFPANTRKQRLWFKGIVEDQGVAHQLIYLQADDELCLSRLAVRRQSQPQRADFDNEKVFRQVTQYFEAPSVDEGFNIETIEQIHERN